ncbi:TetR/AcrR family transcriptional regulator [Arachnia propionica]|uniref:TetR/AcrR family transcriptional regulator n=1 Tax=Arachnia propionica TaxID=1750 RepID=A0A3P1TC71_9ACTN|nr:TetR/AcrR family transcriptional regulator [Arachnia propionica]MDO5083933.1 helix-turn-helix domain-containing protein [Arachnia propionica]RRD06974.1 TetR/AcrR family transcriptional regulator [Arachnia propionica]
MARTDKKQRLRLDPGSRRTAILDAAGKLFASRPYPEVTVAAIAEAAGGSGALVYRYFDGKEGLYAELVHRAIAGLMERQEEAIRTLGEHTCARDRVRAALIVLLDHIASQPRAWAFPFREPGGEPAAVLELRVDARKRYVAELGALLSPSEQWRHDYALWGWLGHVDAACLRWVDQGCPADHRWALLDSLLGALEGALGDWAA